MINSEYPLVKWRGRAGWSWRQTQFDTRYRRQLQPHEAGLWTKDVGNLTSSLGRVVVLKRPKVDCFGLIGLERPSYGKCSFYFLFV